LETVVDAATATRSAFDVNLEDEAVAMARRNW